MKESTKTNLINHIQQMIDSKQNISDNRYMQLYKKYSETEIQSLKDIENSATDFCNFADDIKPMFESGNEVKNKELGLLFKRMRGKIKYLTRTKRFNQQNRFADIVTAINPSLNGTILDVGASEMPYSSIFLAQKDNKVCSMDKNFILSKASLGALKVDSIEKYFTNKTNVENFDFVVGRFPCSAIDKIVERCSKANKPYFIELCDCAIIDAYNAISGDPTTYSLPDDIDGWQNILPFIDPNVRFVEDYAYNIDASTKQISTMIAQVKFQHIINDEKMGAIEIYKSKINSSSLEPIIANDEME